MNISETARTPGPFPPMSQSRSSSDLGGSGGPGLQFPPLGCWLSQAAPLGDWGSQGLSFSHGTPSCPPLQSLHHELPEGVSPGVQTGNGPSALSTLVFLQFPRAHFVSQLPFTSLLQILPLPKSSQWTTTSQSLFLIECLSSTKTCNTWSISGCLPHSFSCQDALDPLCTASAHACCHPRPEMI